MISLFSILQKKVNINNENISDLEKSEKKVKLYIELIKYIDYKYLCFLFKELNNCFDNYDDETTRNIVVENTIIKYLCDTKYNNCIFECLEKLKNEEEYFYCEYCKKYDIIK